MKLIQTYPNFQQADEKALMLRRAGVLAHVADEFSNVHSYASGAFEVSLWVVLDDQYEDACNLLADEDYSVTRPLTENEMQQMEAIGRDSTERLIFNVAMYAAIGFIGLLSYVLIRHATYSGL